MKHLYLWLTATIIILTAGGCTHNDGDIGPLFGEWTLTQLTVDGTAAQIPGEGCVWGFQTDILGIKMLKAHNEYDAYWATWAMDEGNGTFTIDFTHGLTEGQYPAPAGLYMTDEAPMMMTYTLTGKTLSLTYQTIAGQTVTYTLKKQY